MTGQQLTRTDRIEGRIDREVTTGMRMARRGGGTALVIQNAAEAMEFAKMMAISGACVRPHFRDNPGACLGVTLQAMDWGMNPFQVASKTYLPASRNGVEQGLAYEAQLIHAVVLKNAPLQKRLRVEISGTGDQMKATVTGFLIGEDEPFVYVTPDWKLIQPKNSPLWTSDPARQLGYYAVRAWAREHVPEVLLGVYTMDDVEDAGALAGQGPRGPAPPRPTLADVAGEGRAAVWEIEHVDGTLQPVAGAGPFLDELNRLLFHRTATADVVEALLERNHQTVAAIADAGRVDGFDRGRWLHLVRARIDELSEPAADHSADAGKMVDATEDATVATETGGDATHGTETATTGGDDGEAATYQLRDPDDPRAALTEPLAAEALLERLLELGATHDAAGRQRLWNAGKAAIMAALGEADDALRERVIEFQRGFMRDLNKAGRR